MRDGIITALAKAAGVNAVRALHILTQLEAQGLTVYKKKVMKNGRRPNASTPMTPQLRRAIRIYFARNPEATQQEIANLFNVNSGRVNEALEGD
jgi:hypothetical protein